MCIYNVLKAIRRYLLSKIISEQNNVWKKLYLLRKVFLSKYTRRHFSQFAEDVILKEWISKDKNQGFYVDVGCYHPRKFSNTYFLYKRGWRGINIDLDPLKIAAFKLLRPKDCNLKAAISDSENKVKIFSDGLYSLGATIMESITTEAHPNKPFSMTSEITTCTLESLINQTPYANREIDLLNIDAEGHDFNVLKSLKLEKYKPKLIVIESHLRDFNKILNSELYLYLIERGYKFANWVGFSLFFVHPDNNFLKFRI